MSAEPPFRVADLLAGLTLAEKAALTAGSDMWHGNAVERLGVPALKVSDGPVGVRGEQWAGTTSACAPCGAALGATWNPALLREVGRVLGEEALDKAVDLVLAPTVNLHRNPLAGRNFECFSEDPHLSAVAAVAVIDGIQSTGVGACVKHLVANDSEFERHTISSEVGERVLRELYLLPFEAAVLDADVAAVMTAYNRQNGTYFAQHRWLLRDVLKGEWGFAGIVVSDWWGTKAPESLDAGLDLEMPGPAVHLGERAAQRVATGELAEEVLDEAVTRLLGTAARLGVLDRPERPPERSVDRPEHAEVLRRAAREAVVLLRNERVDGRPALPLERGRVRRVAVVGPAADAPAVLGGGSAAVHPHHVVTVRDGLAAALGPDVELVHEIGCTAGRSTPPVDRRRLRHPDGGEGLRVEYFPGRRPEGEPALVQRVPTPRLTWIGRGPGGGIEPADGFSVRLRATFVADVAGAHRFSLVTGGEGATVTLGGETILDNVGDQRPGTAFFGLGSEEIRTEVDLDAGEERELLVEFTSRRAFPPRRSGSATTHPSPRTRSSGPRPPRPGATRRSSSSGSTRTARPRARTASPWSCRAGSRSWCAPCARRTPAPWSWSTPAPWWTSSPHVAPRRCSRAGTWARRPAPRSPTCSSGTTPPPAGCRSPTATAWRTGRRGSTTPARRAGCCTARSCSWATGASTSARPSRGSASGTA